jgi:penicillin-binding protein 1C
MRSRIVIASIGAVLALGLIAFALRPLHARDFAGGADALAFEDRAGLLLGIVLARDSEHAVRVPLENVSPLFIRAIIATEDARFAAHAGVDDLALARAAGEALRRGRIVSGGSTITMQLARLRYGLPHTLPGKLAELELALRIERGMSKREILAAYVNRLPMGGNLTGVEAGARAPKPSRSCRAARGSSQRRTCSFGSRAAPRHGRRASAPRSIVNCKRTSKTRLVRSPGR